MTSQLITLGSLLNPFTNSSNSATSVGTIAQKFSIDVLAVSCAYHRIKNIETEHPERNKIISIHDSKLIDLVTNSDIEQAQAIRKYFEQKLIMLELKNIKLSSFRKSLATFLSRDPLILEASMVGLIYKLPSFFIYDSALDVVRSTFEIKNLSHTEYKQYSSDHMLDLMPVKKIDRDMRGVKVIDYWFKNKNNISICMTIDKKNPLIKIWDRIFDTSNMIHFDGYMSYKNHSDFGYCVMNKWEMLSHTTVT